MKMLLSPVWVVPVAAFAACGFPKPADVPECSVSADCKSSAAPLCVNSQCVAGCKLNDDCQGAPATPFCQQSSGACVGCLDATSCPIDKPVCDATSLACRGCARDAECATAQGTGICIEADATCVPDSSVVFVDSAGLDADPCSRAAPCSSLTFALTRTSSTRDNVKILSGTLQLGASVTLSRSVYMEGNDTIVSGPPGMFVLPQSVNVTLSHMKLQPTSGSVATVGSIRTLRLFDVQSTGSIDVNGGGLEIDTSSFSATSISCTAGTMTIRRSVFDRAPVSGVTCTLVIRRNRFDMVGDKGFSAQSGPLTFENNLITQTEGIADSVGLFTVSPGSTVRFNTFVNTASLASDGVALYCDTPVEVSSNIFAYGSMHPTGGSPRCASRYSLYDSVAIPVTSTGTGDKVGDSNAFFVDKVGKNFHLAPTSPARRGGEAGLPVSDDYDGAPRPQASGEAPDMGAFEAP